MEKIKVVKDGPYLVEGYVPLKKEVIVRGEEGIPIEWKIVDKYQFQEMYGLCRCGRTYNQPFCDGTHSAIGFDGSETARREEQSDRAKLYEGPEIDLEDHEELCAGLCFCKRAGGVWTLVERSDDPEAKRIAVEEIVRCAAGRLVAFEKDGTPIEPKLFKSISVVEDPGKGVSGPLWVKNGILIESADGEAYEQRNRVTLCRCGASGNKPFCDRSHESIRFNDGDATLL